MANSYLRLLCIKTVFYSIGFCMLLGCNDTSQNTTLPSGKDPEKQSSVIVEKEEKPDVENDKPKPPTDQPKEYSNARFKEVTVQKIGDGRYSVQGKAQVFEASFSWVVEDGHNELNKGHQMTDAGAPEWGKFEFTVEARKQRANSTLTLVLFEISAKDGSRQHELPITLE